MKRAAATDDAVREVRAIYQDWASRPIDRACTGVADCCRFRLVGHTPYLTRGEALVAARAWKAAGRKDVTIPADGSSVNIAGLSLPVGTWMIRARLDASLPSTASGMRTSQVTCQIGTGALSEAMAARLATPALAPSASSDDSAMLVGWMPATFTAPGRAIVSCRQTQATGNGAAAAAVVPGNIRITATRADSLQTLPITP